MPEDASVSPVIGKCLLAGIRQECACVVKGFYDLSPCLQALLEMQRQRESTRLGSAKDLPPRSGLPPTAPSAEAEPANSAVAGQPGGRSQSFSGDCLAFVLRRFLCAGECMGMHHLVLMCAQVSLGEVRYLGSSWSGSHCGTWW
jgi:hypothetical protein